MSTHNYFEVINSFDKNKEISTKFKVGPQERIQNPIFSIVIPTYKREVLLNEAIKSALNQNFDGCYEVIVVDDEALSQGENQTEKVIKTIGSNIVYYYRNEQNLGQHGNWNRCYELASGEWVCMLHDDDKLSPKYLSDLYKIIKTNTNVGFISCRLEILMQKAQEKKSPSTLKKLGRQLIDCLTPKLTKFHLSDYLFGFKTYIVGSCVKRELVIKNGGFNADFFPSSDYYFTVKFAQQFDNIYLLRKKNYIYRILNNESLNPITFKKFITRDFYFTKLLTDQLQVKCLKLISFLNNQYVINRVIHGGNLYGVRLDLNEVLQELNIDPKNNSKAYRIIGIIIFKGLNIYRSIFKY